MSCEQIKIFTIPVSDIGNKNFSIDIVDNVAADSGQAIVKYMRNRNLNSAWVTTGSDDSAETKIICNISDSAEVSDFFLIGHNFKSFDLDYWNGSSWTNIETIIDNESDFYHYEGSADILTTKIRVVVHATITIDADKMITRLMICDRVESGQFLSWPEIKKPTHYTVKKVSKMLSGKSFLSEVQGSFSVDLSWTNITDQEDVDIIEQMFLARKGFMIWLSGGDEAQFKFRLTGYRKQDFYIMKPSKNYINAYYKGIYNSGIPQSIKLVEIVE